MKSLSLLLVAISLVSTSAFAQKRVAGIQLLAAGNNSFGAKLLETYKTKEVNKLVSPYSAEQALLMLANGAANSTRRDLLQVLTGQTTTDLDVLNSANAVVVKGLNALVKTDEKVFVNITNSIWVNKGFELKTDYVTALTSNYAAVAKTVDMSKDSTVKEINALVAKNTTDPRNKEAKPKIPELLKKGATSGAELALVNTTYIIAAWSKQFDEKRTVGDAHFGHPAKDESLPVRTMVQSGNHKVATPLQGVQALEKSLGDGSTSVVFFVPSNGNVAELEKTLAAGDTLSEALKTVSDTDETFGEVWIPKTKVESNIDLKEPLTALKLGYLFSNPDLSRISEQGGLKVSKAIQKAVFEMNEKGIEAAAATVIIATRSASLPQRPAYTFKVDRPFVVVVKENAHNNVLFIGSVNNPGTGK